MPAGLYAYRQGWLITCSLMAVWIHIHDHRDIMGRWGSLKIQLIKDLCQRLLLENGTMRRFTAERMDSINTQMVLLDIGVL